MGHIRCTESPRGVTLRQGNAGRGRQTDHNRVAPARGPRPPQGLGLAEETRPSGSKLASRQPCPSPRALGALGQQQGWPGVCEHHSLSHTSVLGNKNKKIKKRRLFLGGGGPRLAPTKSVPDRGPGGLRGSPGVSGDPAAAQPGGGGRRAPAQARSPLHAAPQPPPHPGMQSRDLGSDTRGALRRGGLGLGVFGGLC